MSTQRWLQAALFLEKARTTALVAVAATLSTPASIGINGGFIITTAVLSLALLICRRVAGLPRRPAAWPLPTAEAAFFLLYVAGLFWSPFDWVGPFVERKLALIAFPAIVAFCPPSKRERDLALFWFTVMITLVGLFGEFLALGQYLRFGHSYYFVGDSLILPYTLHRVYISLHALFALCALTLVGKEWASGIWRGVWQLGLVLFILLLASRNTTLTMLILAGVYAIAQLMRGRIRVAVYVGAAVTACLALSLSIPQVRSILSASKIIRTDWGTPATVNQYDGWQVRHFVWQAVDTLAKDTPWYGRGTGSVNVVLGDTYRKMGFTYAVVQALNAHNQYLQTWLELGWPGLALLVSILLIGFWQGWRGRPLLLALSLLASLSMVTESYMEAQKGVVFFGFMWALLGSEPLRKREAEFSEGAPTHG